MASKICYLPITVRQKFNLTSDLNEVAEGNLGERLQGANRKTAFKCPERSENAMWLLPQSSKTRRKSSCRITEKYL